MADVLVRNIDEDDLKAIDALAASQGLSRNELLRREAHELARRQKDDAVTVDALRMSLALTTDVLDDDVMRGAWE
ncbi:type II toxin-antitoxin system VapB family antitoxin [Flexivirga sp. B27]